MAITFTKQTRGGTNYTLNALSAENFKIITGSWSMPSTYAADGITVNLATLGFASGQIMFAYFTASTHTPLYDYANDKLKLFIPTSTGTHGMGELQADRECTGVSGMFVCMGYGAH